LGDEGELSKKTIDQIWMVLESDKTVADAVYEVLGAISNYLEDKIQAYIFSKIQDLPLEEYTTGTVVLISELNKIKDEMIQKLWSLIQDESTASKEIFDMTLDTLLEKCSNYTTKSYLNAVMRLSLNGLKSGQSALQCILLLFRITSNTKHFADEKETPRYAAMMKKKEGEATRRPDQRTGVEARHAGSAVQGVRVVPAQHQRRIHEAAGGQRRRSQAGQPGGAGGAGQVPPSAQHPRAAGVPAVHFRVLGGQIG